MAHIIWANGFMKNITMNLREKHHRENKDKLVNSDKFQVQIFSHKCLNPSSTINNVTVSLKRLIREPGTM